jgi:polysaccharide pyruvyl transferase WcaK-like protein
LAIATKGGLLQMKKKRIGLVGFFGWGNFGDELFVDVYKQWLAPEFELQVLHDLPRKPYFSRPISEVLEGVDAIVIGGGDLIIPWTVSGLYWKKEYLDRPIYICGVGVPTWKKALPPVVAELREFLSSDSIRFINMRDRESAAWVTKHLQPQVTPSHSADIVFALDLPRVAKPEGQPILGIVTRDRGKSDELANVEALCRKAMALGYRIRHLVLATGELGERDAARADELVLPGKETIRSESVSDLCRAIGECTALASMKFHGTVVATAYGVPSIVLSPTDKSRNLMRMIDRPELLSSIDAEDLDERLPKHLPVIPQTTRRFLRRRAVATMNALKQELHAL